MKDCSNRFNVMFEEYILCAGVTLCIMEHTVEASEARWIADPFIDQLRFGLAHEDIVINSILFCFFFGILVESQTCSSFDLLRSELAEKEEGKEEEAEKRKKKLEEKAARKRELMLKSLME